MPERDPWAVMPESDDAKRLREDRKLLTRIDTYGEGLSSWEIEFVESCLQRLERGLPLTEKQRVIAERIDEAKVE